MSKVEDFMRKPCAQCPFRRDVRPYLHPDRALEIADAALNPYNEFPCHKTLSDDEDGEGLCVTEESKTCAGFLTMRAQYDDSKGIPEGFEPDWYGCYSDGWEMSEAYANEWARQRGCKNEHGR